MSKLELHWKIIIGLILGVFWALLSSYLGKIDFLNTNWSKLTINWIGPFGTIFINLLKLIAIPLILFSIIKGVSEISDIKRLGRVGFKTLFLYIITTLIAVTVGLGIVNMFKPGQMVDNNIRIENRLRYEAWAILNEIEIVDNKDYTNDPKYLNIRAKLVDEGFKKMTSNTAAETSTAVMKKVQSGQATSKKHKKESPIQILVDIVPSNIFDALSGKGFMLQIIFFAIFFGAVLLTIEKSKAEPIIKLFDGFNDVFLKMIEVIMKASPIFVFALLAGKISEMAPNDPAKMLQLFQGLGWYSLFVILGLMFMVLVFYPILVMILTKGKVSYFNFMKGIRKAQTLAFSTSSSAATLPVTMDCVHNNLDVPKEISSFVLPIGATVNMDGTSLYISIAVVFLAQFHLIDLTVSQQLIIVSTATLASIGASAVPSAGLIMMIMVLQSVGLNPAWIAIIFPVDRILDMCRTVVNVTGDASVAKIVAETEKS